MRQLLIRMLLVFLVFFIGTGCILFLDNLCNETTGGGGKLVLDVANSELFQ